MIAAAGVSAEPLGHPRAAGPAGLSCLGVKGQGLAPFRATSLHWGRPSEAILGEGCSHEPASHRQLSWSLKNESLGPGAWKGNWVCTQQVCRKAAGGTGCVLRAGGLSEFSGTRGLHGETEETG